MPALTHEQSQIIAQLLILLSLGVDGEDHPDEDWGVFYDLEPDLPDNCITVYNTSSKDNGRTQTDGERQELLGFQVRVRSKEKELGSKRSRLIAIAFEESVENLRVTVDTTNYHMGAISKASGPMYIGKEIQSQRDVFTINFLVDVRQLN